eukprot:339270_1
MIERVALTDFCQEELECIFCWIDPYDLISLLRTSKIFGWIPFSCVLAKNAFKYLSRKFDIKHPLEQSKYGKYEIFMMGYRNNYINYLMNYNANIKQLITWPVSDHSYWPVITYKKNSRTIAYIKALKLSNLYQDRLNYIYSRAAFKRLRIFSSINIFQTYSRLASYATNGYSLFNPHSSKQVMQSIVPRDLHPLTLQLFDICNLPFSTSNITNNKQCLINDLNQFKDELKSRFYYDKWKDNINWNHFILAGGSALKCILKNTFISNNSDHDIDLFAYNIDLDTFYNDVRRFYGQDNKKYGVELYELDQGLGH